MVSRHYWPVKIRVRKAIPSIYELLQINCDFLCNFLPPTLFISSCTHVSRNAGPESSSTLLRFSHMPSDSASGVSDSVAGGGDWRRGARMVLSDWKRGEEGLHFLVYAKGMKHVHNLTDHDS